jgi:hypothetical protein
MLKAVISINSVDYSAVAQTVIPIILEKKKAEAGAGKLVTVLSKLKGLSGKTAAAALKVLPQSTKDDIAISVIQSYEEEILDKVNAFMQDKNLHISVSDIHITKTDTIEIGLSFNQIDYNAVISTSYPLVMARFKANDKFSKLFSVIDKLGDKSADLIQATLEVLSQDEKDEIVSCIICAYEQEIVTLVNSLAAENDLKVSVAGFEIKKI